MTIGIIFDLNGVIIDDVPFHRKAWKEFWCRRGREISDKEFERQIDGRPNSEIFSTYLSRPLKSEEISELEAEKEQLYRDLYGPHLSLLPGLAKLFEELQQERIPMAVATSAPPVNIPFVIDGLQIRKFFKRIVTPDDIQAGKPDPEIFLTAAASLEIAPEDCLVFEDSFLGIEAAKRGKMKVIGIGTTHTAEELEQADLVISDFREINYRKIVEFMSGK